MESVNKSTDLHYYNNDLRLLKAHLHDTTSRIRFSSCRMKTIADATIPVHQFYSLWRNSKCDIFTRIYSNT
jgi:hypothetical protein